MMLDDLTGAVEALVFANSHERLAPEVTEDQAVLVRAWRCPKRTLAAYRLPC
jgi:hypothetical protein